MTTYFPAPEVSRVAKKVIDKWHPDLRAIRIEYLFRDKAAKRKGRTVGGTAELVKGKHALLATDGATDSDDLAFFLVVIASDVWTHMTDAQKEALVDHELQHFVVDRNEDDEVVLKLRGHDVEAFFSEIPRHGLWKTDLEMFVSSMPAEQLEFTVPSIIGDTGESAGQTPANEDGEPNF